jgi:hypothetical protein
MSALLSDGEPEDLPWDGPSRRLTQAEIDRQRFLSDRAARANPTGGPRPKRVRVRALAPHHREEALRLARSLVDGASVSRADATSDDVWEAVWGSATGVASARHGVMLQRRSSRAVAARWLAKAKARIEDTFATGGAP